MTTHKFICPGGVLYARITDVHQPLTVEMLRLLFRQSGDGDMICAFERVVDVMYGVEAYVQFGSRCKAAQARAALDGQAIYDGSCVLAVDLVPSAYTTITMPDGDEWTPAHFFDDTPYAEWDEALAVAEHHNEASASTFSPISASAVSTTPTNLVPVVAATGIPVSSTTSAAPASCGVTSLVASATNRSTSPGGDTGAAPYTTPLVSTGPIGVSASTMQSEADHVLAPINCSTLGLYPVANAIQVNKVPLPELAVSLEQSAPFSSSTSMAEVSASDDSELALAMSAMCSTECPGEGNNGTRATPTPTTAPLSSSTTAAPATCEVSTKVSSMALVDVSLSAPTHTDATATERLYPLLNITLGKLAPTKCSIECSEVGTHTMMLDDAQSSALSLGLSVSNAQLDSAHKLFNERPWHADIDNDSKLNKVVSRGNVPVAALTTLNSNSSDLIQELRPLPWPSFVQIQNGDQLTNDSSLEACWGCCITETLLGNTRGFSSGAWMDFVQSKGIIGVHSDKPWLPLQGMYRLHYFGKPHEGICFFHIGLHSHATSLGTGRPSQALAEMTYLFRELSAIGNLEQCLMYVHVARKLVEVNSLCSPGVHLSVQFEIGVPLNQFFQCQSIENSPAEVFYMLLVTLEHKLSLIKLLLTLWPSETSQFMFLAISDLGDMISGLQNFMFLPQYDTYSAWLISPWDQGAKNLELNTVDRLTRFMQLMRILALGQFLSKLEFKESGDYIVQSAVKAMELQSICSLYTEAVDSLRMFLSGRIFQLSTWINTCLPCASSPCSKNISLRYNAADVNGQDKGTCQDECKVTLLIMVATELMHWKDCLLLINVLSLVAGIPFALEYGEFQASLQANSVAIRSFCFATFNEFVHVFATDCDTLFSSEEKLYQCIVPMLQLQWDPGDCSISVWRHENLADRDDVYPGHGIATLQVTWDPGGSTQFWFEDKADDWVQDGLRTPWDPGGVIQHRLGGKSNLMGEGLSATWALLHSNQYPAQPSLKPQALQIPRGDNKHGSAWNERALAWPCLAGDLSLSRSSSSSSLLCSSPDPQILM